MHFTKYTNTTIVTTCMGRLGHIKKCLPGWIENTPYPIILVDYSCPDKVGSWVLESGLTNRVSVVCAEALEESGVKVFNASRARNLGAKLVDEGSILFLDSDTILSPRFHEWIPKNQGSRTFYVPMRPQKRSSDIGGVMLIPAKAFHSIGGFDEDICGWGHEDTDIKVRLYLNGQKPVLLPVGLIKSIPHSNKLRTQFHQEKSIRNSTKTNISMLSVKYLKITGRTLPDWMNDSNLRRVFGKIPRR